MTSAFFRNLHFLRRENLKLSGRDSMRFAWSELTFDTRYGVRTAFIVPVEGLDFSDAELQQEARRYRPSPAYVIQTTLRTSSSFYDLDGNSTFVDFGCGAGRAMILAAELGFRHVVGIELSARLVQMCNKNMARYERRRCPGLRYEVHCMDAGAYEPPPTAIAFYVYKSFKDNIYERVFSNIKASLQAAPRRAAIVDVDHVGTEFEGFRLVDDIGVARVYAYAPHREGVQPGS